jgi:hypothetical protein
LRREKKMKRIGVFILIVFLFIGCAHGGKISRVRSGISVNELQNIMGPYQGYKKVGEYEVCSYYNQFVSNRSSARADYHYIFKNGKLVEFGAGAIRLDQTTNKPYIMPLK